MQIVGLLFILLLVFITLKFALRIFGHLLDVFTWITDDIRIMFSTAYRRFDNYVNARISTITKPKDVKEQPLEIIPAPPAEKAAAAFDGDWEVTGHTGKIHLAETPSGNAGIPAISHDDGLQETLRHSNLSVHIAGSIVYFLIRTVMCFIEAYQRLPEVINSKFPLLSTLAYVKVMLCILPLEIIRKIPDIYGLTPIFSTVKQMAAGYAVFLACIYLARLFVPYDTESFFDGGDGPHHDRPKHAKALWRSASLIYFMWIALLLIVILNKYTLWAASFSLFMSAAYFLMPLWKDRSALSLIRTGPPILFAATGAIVTIAYPDFLHLSGHAFSLPVTLALLVPAIITYAYWKQLLGPAAARQSMAAKCRTAIDFFIAPFVRLIVIIPGFYFILMFYTLNPAIFAAAIVTTAAALIAVSKLTITARTPSRPGFFTAYFIILWISILFVQSYNRIAPPQSSCSALTDTGSRHCILPMEKYRENEFLTGALPYDTILDSAENAMFVSFKNLSGYGAILRIDPATGRLDDYVVTDNDLFSRRMFYPERFCIDRKARRLYSTTKSMNHFQILALDYSNDTLRLSHRINFGNYETTNCEVDTTTGDIYVIFLGPPYSQIIPIDGRAFAQKPPIRFGSLGYADYFTLNADTGRIVSPSLDPKRYFDLYDVKVKHGNFTSITRKPFRLSIALPGGGKLPVPLPTFGIAEDKARNRFYFTCPFLRLVIQADGDDFRITRVLFAGNFPRKIAYNPQQRILLVANYGDGTVDLVDTDRWEIVKHIKVGKLVRSVRVDEETGRNFAVTACGVFELFGPEKQPGL